MNKKNSTPAPDNNIRPTLIDGNELEAIIAKKRAEQAAMPHATKIDKGWEPAKKCTRGEYDAAVARLVARLPDPIELSPQEVKDRQRRAEELQKRREAAERQDAVDRLLAMAGERYCEADFSNYEISHARQEAAIGILQKYVDEFSRQSGSIIFTGNVGSGKDTLALATAKELIYKYGITAEWYSGQMIYSSLRGAIESQTETEKKIIGRLVAPQLLILSDLAPPSGRISDYQALSLYNIVDQRYRGCKQTIITINAASPREVSEKIGVQVTDRLRHGATVIHCDWPSYRAALETF